RRFDEVLEILRKKGPGSAFYVASHMVWDLVAENWEAFPIMQKWFASGEALAHLRYLEEESAVEQKVVDDILIFSAV
ncbi:MAG TPA: hypothetical protein VLH18_01165, partial [Candidatus Limnocylindrales bacterium]|nr:hypothetical protein [Candidatus Limnocylindrales bacterium]